MESDELEDLRSRLQAPDAFRLLVEVAHDFRSPLTSILFLSETLRDGHSGPVTEQQRSQLGLIYSAAFGLANIASDLIDLAREERELLDLDPQPFSLEDVFSNVERLVNPIVEEKGLELRIRLPERSTANGYPRALSRILLNLTSNALKYTERGWVEVGVVHLPRNRLEFFVEDTGRGIPESLRDELFRPFTRGPEEGSAEPLLSGSGIGLSIARRLLTAMGTDLELASTEGSGSRFSFVLTDSPSGR